MYGTRDISNSCFKESSNSKIALETFVAVESAIGSGYGESKWVSEKILSVAGSETTLCPTVVRVGQVAGGKNGSWNKMEWLPSIVQSASLVKCLPDLDQVKILCCS